MFFSVLGSGPNSAIIERIANVSWYHSMPLGDGILTPGSFDTLDELSRLPFPRSLEGKRCLDVATSDGFFAFEMERRGAEEVVAIDVRPENLDWPPNARTNPSYPGGPRQERGFDVAHDLLESGVRWREHSVYEVRPESLGEFDFVFMGSVLGHLRDPTAALAAVRSVLRGELLSVDALSLPLSVLHPRQAIARFEAPGWPLWWVPNLRAYRRLFESAGLQIVVAGTPFFLKRGPAYSESYGATSEPRRALHQRAKRAAGARFGNLHAWVRANAS